MSHPQQINFLSLVGRHFLPAKLDSLKILEIGSYDVNGSVRGLFAGSHYVGVDLVAGPGVDLVCSGHKIQIADASFDLALSTECFEHNPFWIETFRNMHRLTKDTGLVVVTCASKGRIEHGTSRTTPGSSPGTQAIGSEYYRNLGETDFLDSFDLGKMFSAWRFFYVPSDLFFVGWKGSGPSDLRRFESEARKLREPVALKHAIYYLPVSLASKVLSEPRFQDFAVAYMNRTRSLRRLAGRLSGRK